MNAEALIGTVLGSCTLQKLVGQGGMGAVFLAQQSRPRRQVAVKILLPMAPLSPNQLAAFLERFRRETDAAASMEHPNIVPVHEYGERDGLAYLVMPYISGGTLRDEMEREGPLPLATVANYLDQVAAALDYAHKKGVIHRDIKPANILMTPEGRLLLTDFGLVKIVAEGSIPQTRLTGEGAPVGTPDYMAPEQVIGEDVDSRADLYSLGVIVYQMVTGTTPFQGESPMQIAAQHLQTQPPAPRQYRPDLPFQVEQVMLKALSKRPADRYQAAQDMAVAFRQALGSLGQSLFAEQAGPATSSRLFVPTGFTGQMGQVGKVAAPTAVDGFDAGQQFRPTGMLSALKPTGQMPVADLNPPTGTVPGVGGLQVHAAKPAERDDFGQATGVFPASENRGGGGLLSRTGMFPSITKSAGTNDLSSTNSLPSATLGAQPGATGAMSAPMGGGLLSRTGRFPTIGTQKSLAISPMMGAQKTLTASPAMGTEENMFSASSAYSSTIQAPDSSLEQFSPVERTATGALQDGQSPKTTMKLSSAMKVVQMPVAGQPGQYVTGLLSMNDDGAAQQILPEKKPMPVWTRIVLVVLAVLVVAGGAGGWIFLRNQRANQTQTTATTGAPNPKATAMMQATATAQANIILADPLDHNIHGWYESTKDGYVFENGAYHIINHNDNNSSATVLPSFSYNGPMAYTLTLQELKGDDTSDVNSFGMIFRYTQQTSGKNTVSKFYSFEVQNRPGGEYKFWKYDSSKGAGAAAWGDPIWHQAFGNEFHEGHGAKAVNTFKVVMNGNQFTFIVNGKTIKTVSDKSYANGSVGMIVNLNGTEVDFKNLLLTKN